MNNLNRPDFKEIFFVDRLLKYIVDIIVAIMLAVFFVTTIAHTTTVKGNSMLPALNAESNIFVNTIAYKFFSPDRYDIVVFFVDGDKSTPYVKRILGLPGDTVYISKGKLYVNGTEETYNSNKDDIVNAGMFSDEVILKEDEYFVIGDNWNNSTDSRSESVGLISFGDIYGKAWFKVSPVSDFGAIK